LPLWASNSLTEKMGYAVPALASIQLALSQSVGFARRNDGGPQTCGDPTFINGLVNGEVAPIPVIEMRAS
jgi:hypothetical protein